MAWGGGLARYCWLTTAHQSHSPLACPAQGKTPETTYLKFMGGVGALGTTELGQASRRHHAPAGNPRSVVLVHTPSYWIIRWTHAAVQVATAVARSLNVDPSYTADFICPFVHTCSPALARVSSKQERRIVARCEHSCAACAISHVSC